MLSIHMKKIEELTLYLIDLKKENDLRKKENDLRKKENDELKARIESIESQISK